MPGQDLGFPATHGACEAAHLCDVAGVGPGIQQLKDLAGRFDGGSTIQVAGDLFELPGGGDLAIRVAGAQSLNQPGPALVVEVVAGFEQQLADPVQRICLAAAMPGLLLLHAAVVRRRSSG